VSKGGTPFQTIARLRGDWNHLFQNRVESRDIGSFTVEIQTAAVSSDEAMHELVRNSLSSAFGDRRYAYAVTRQADGALTVQGAVVLRSGQGERLTGDDKASSIIQARYDASAAARFSFQGYGNGVEYGASKLRSLVERHDGNVRDDRGQVIGDEKHAGDPVQKEWRGDLHSRKGRDVMHLIMSARAGTNVEAFEKRQSPLDAPPGRCSETERRQRVLRIEWRSGYDCSRPSKRKLVRARPNSRS
jgi:hypothetical protein